MSFQQALLALGVLGAGYAALVLWVYLSQDRLIFLPDQPGRSVNATPETVGLDYERVTLEAEDGIHLDGWLVPAPEERAVVAFFHGNAGNIGHRLDTLRLFHELGLSVLIVDYRGYGRSEGEPSEVGLYRDGEAMWQYLRHERGIPPERIVLVGRSLGTAVAAHTAAQHRPGALVLESPFISIPELGQAIYPYLPVRWIAKYRFATAEHAARCRCPVLVIHSTHDEIVPIGHGRAVFDRLPGPKRFLELTGGHDSSFVEDEATYRAGLEAFLAEHLGAAPVPEPNE